MASQSPQVPKTQGQTPSDRVVVGPRETCIPKGLFLLVRKSGKYGAIRLLTIKPGNEPQTGAATYESYFQDDGTGSFLSANAIRKSGDLSTKPLSGIGRFSFGGGKRKLRVGGWVFAYHFPGCVDMYPCGEVEGDYGFEFAPTSAMELAEIDVFDKRLRWFRYDLNRREYISISDLAK